MLKEKILKLGANGDDLTAGSSLVAPGTLHTMINGAIRWWSYSLHSITSDSMGPAHFFDATYPNVGHNGAGVAQ